jgi:AcrR family transcriptional regulator
MVKRTTSQPGLAELPGEPPQPALADESAELWDPAYPGVARDLLSAAVRCFAGNGYHGTTTRDISLGAGLSPAALYVHFSSKESVLFEIVRRAHEHALAEIRTASLAPDADPTAALAELMSRYTAWHARHHVAARVAQLELAGLTPEHYEHVVALRRATGELFREVVTRGVDDGSFVVAEVAPVVRAMLSLSIDLVRWYRLEDGDSPEQLGRLYAQLAVRMVRG